MAGGPTPYDAQRERADAAEAERDDLLAELTAIFHAARVSDAALFNAVKHCERRLAERGTANV